MLTSTLALITPDFLLTVVIASSSGALTPGPLFLASTLRATRTGWFAGVECAVGHSMMELPLVLGLSIGLSSFLLGSIRIIGALGGATLIAFAILQLAQARTKIDMNVQPPSKWDKRSGVLVGLVFTAINPFFIIWWATVGSLLVAQALRTRGLHRGPSNVRRHIWMDYAWLGGTASLASRGKFFLGKWYRILLFTFGLGMLYFGAEFHLTSIT